MVVRPKGTTDGPDSIKPFRIAFFPMFLYGDSLVYQRARRGGINGNPHDDIINIATFEHRGRA